MRKIFVIVFIVFLSSCQNDRRIMTDAVSQMIGKAIVFPDDLFVFNNPEDIDIQNYLSVRSVVVYIDAYECSICKIKEMREWDKLILRFWEMEIPTIVIVNSENIQEYIQETKLQNIKPILAYDANGVFSDINNLSDDPRLHSFLLENGSISLVGNPYTNPHVEELYLKFLNEIQ